MGPDPLDPLILRVDTMKTLSKGRGSNRTKERVGRSCFGEGSGRGKRRGRKVEKEEGEKTEELEKAVTVYFKNSPHSQDKVKGSVDQGFRGKFTLPDARNLGT